MGFFKGQWPTFSHESQIPDWVGLILGQIPHCMEESPSEMSRVGARGEGGGQGMGVLELAGT